MMDRFNDYYATVSQHEGEWLQTEWDEGTAKYNPGFVAPVTQWSIQLTAHDLTGTCTWTIPRAIGGANSQGPCADPVSITLPAGDSRVEVTDSAGQKAHAIVTPRDVLILSLGDSYASGEGVPDQRRWLYWNVKWVDQRCHRSLYSAPSLAALMYSDLNHHVSVTHVSFACSGAGLVGGVLPDGKGAGYRGIDPEKDPALPPQSVEAAAVVKARNQVVDYVTLSAGGNDLGFAKIVEAALGNIDDLRTIIDANLAKGPGLVLAEAPNFRPALGLLATTPVLLTGYADATYLKGQTVQQGSATANLCSVESHEGVDVVDFIPRFFGWALGSFDSAKIDLLHVKLLPELQTMMTAEAGALGASLVDDFKSEFQKHGYCAPGLSNDADVRWVNTVRDSFGVQMWKFGAMHPNIRGQAAYGGALFKHIHELECVKLDNEIKATTEVDLLSEKKREYELLCGQDWHKQLSSSVTRSVFGEAQQ